MKYHTFPSNYIRLIFLLGICFIISGCGSGESSSSDNPGEDPQDEYTTPTLEYRLIKQENFNYQGNRTGYWTYSYSPEGKLESITEYDNNDVKKETTIETYNDNGLISSFTKESGLVTKNEFNNKGILIKCETSDTSGIVSPSKTIYYLDANNNRVKSEYYVSEVYQSYYVYTIDSNNRRSSFTEYDKNGNKNLTGMNTYNSNNYLSKVNCTNVNNSSLSYSRVFTYEKGNTTYNFLTYSLY